MGYDGNEKPVVISLESKQEDYDAALQDYQAKSDIILQQIAEATARLNEINAAIVERKRDLDDWVSKKAEDLDHTLSTLIENIDQKTAALNQLDTEIAAKQDLSKSIQSDYREQQKNIDAQNRKNIDEAARLKVLDDSLNQRAIDINTQQEALDISEANSEGAFERRNEQLLNREIAVTGRENDIRDREKSMVDSQARLDNTLALIADKQAALEKQMADAQLILDQAAEVKAHIDSIQMRIDAVNRQEKQNQEDANQIFVTQQALANQKADLNARQAALTAAEAKKVEG